MSLSCVFSIDFFRDEFNIIVEAEDAGDDFTLERYALGVYNELCMALGGLVEEE